MYSNKILVSSDSFNFSNYAESLVVSAKASGFDLILGVINPNEQVMRISKKLLVLYPDLEINFQQADLSNLNGNEKLSYYDCSKIYLARDHLIRNDSSTEVKLFLLEYNSIVRFEFLFPEGHLVHRLNGCNGVGNEAYPNFFVTKNSITYLNMVISYIESRGFSENILQEALARCLGGIDYEFFLENEIVTSDFINDYMKFPVWVRRNGLNNNIYDAWRKDYKIN